MSEDDVGGGGKLRNSTVTAGAGEYFTPYPDQVLENVLENVLVFLKSRRDRNAVSLVCKSWYRAEADTRSDLFIGNCYAVSPRRVTNRFKRVRSLYLKGKPRFNDFSLLPTDWGANFTPWLSAMATAYHALEKIYLKRMTITDEDLVTIAVSLPNFKELVLVCCEDFGTSGLAIIASECRNLRVLELIEDDVSDDDEIDWITYFPTEGTTNLESLCFDCVESPIDFNALESLVSRSPMLKKLRLNRHVSIGQLYRLALRAPQLTHLGTGSFGPLEITGQQQADNQEPDYISAFAACRSITCLSGFREIAPEYLPAIFPVCVNLTSLNLSYANIDAEQLKPVIRLCHKLQALDSICDEGLQAVADACKDLRELRIFPVDGDEVEEGPVSEVGLLAISLGCRKLQSILYFCQQMTNAAIIAMSKNCPDLVVFRLCIITRYRPDRVTGEPMDEGFGAIVKNCKKLTRLAVSGLLTDRAFSYIGQYGKLVRTLSVGFSAASDTGLKHVLEGCTNLQKLEIRDCLFGDSGLHSGLHHFYNMRFVWLSTCRLTRQGCLEVARRLPKLVVEIFREDVEEGGEKVDFVDTLYMYRSLDGPRADAPPCVKIL